MNEWRTVAQDWLRIDQRSGVRWHGYVIGSRQDPGEALPRAPGISGKMKVMRMVAAGVPATN